jgi:RpiB/LacA/LacB family sugar-phosphate isomerase
MRIVVGADHAGYELKEVLKAFIAGLDHTVIDVGADSTAPSDYPDVAQRVGESVAQSAAERGVLICGSGVGASIAANKVPGVRAAVCHDTFSAHQGVEHDNMNVLTLGARIIGEELAKELVRAYLSATFSREERHLRRVGKIDGIEARYRNR